MIIVIGHDKSIKNNGKTRSLDFQCINKDTGKLFTFRYPNKHPNFGNAWKYASKYLGKVVVIDTNSPLQSMRLA